jgi:phage gpG-like protein
MNVEATPDGWKKGNTTLKKFREENAKFSTSTKLTNQSGALLQSFLPNNKNSSTATFYSTFQLGATIGSKLPYASVHEYGGFIKHKGKMPYYFFYLYKKTGNEFWQRLGASALKKGGVNIPRRPYFYVALDKYKNDSNGFNKTLNNLLSILTKDLIK